MAVAVDVALALLMVAAADQDERAAAAMVQRWVERGALPPLGALRALLTDAINGSVFRPGPGAAAAATDRKKVPGGGGGGGGDAVGKGRGGRRRSLPFGGFSRRGALRVLQVGWREPVLP